jgi:hypothetical protein
MVLIRRGPQALSQRDPFGGWLFDWPEFIGGFEPFRPLLAGQLHLEEFIDDGKLVIRVELPGIDPDKDLELTVSEGACTSSQSGGWTRPRKASRSTAPNCATERSPGCYRCRSGPARRTSPPPTPPESLRSGCRSTRTRPR